MSFAVTGLTMNASKSGTTFEDNVRQREMERAGRTDCPAERCTPMSKRRSASSELYHHPSDDLLDSDADDPTEELCQPYTPRRPVDPCVPQRPAADFATK